ncbi:hypothetical protein LOD99_14889 [Oopsacas minuta]|uniref:Uncharacterized protein n=1 Tax=Oopsacas minuta TaxID=111878 RepID=A0AAV7KFU2_9METZ|nr:hypothetical protein LOD99_14889 [Oopsacas minuta]
MDVTTDGERLITSTFPFINSDNYWLINSNNPDVTFGLAADTSTFTFVITSIQIQIFVGSSITCTLETTIRSADYLISYNIGQETRVLNLATDSTHISDHIASIEIEPIPADSITIVKRTGIKETFCMRYGLVGYQIARVSVLNYDISVPNLQMDNEYTGLCGSEFCIGGKGRLTDGNTEIETITTDGVGWNCQSDRDQSCIFYVKIKLSRTAYISRVVIFGLIQGSDRLPEVKMTSNPDKSPTNGILIDNIYSITTSIDSNENLFQFSFTVAAGTNIVLSEIAVFTGEDVNIAVENVGYNYVGEIPEEERPTSSHIANFQNGASFDAQTIGDRTETGTTIPSTTTESTITMENTNTFQSTISTISTTQIDASTAVDPQPLKDDCTARSVFFSIVGTLGIFVITTLLNSIIIIVLLARNNRKVRRKLHALQNSKTESFRNYAENVQQETVIVNSISIDDVYDSLTTRDTSNQRDSGFDSPSNANPIIRNSTYCINSNLMNQNSSSITVVDNTSCHQAVPHINQDTCVQDEHEVQMEDNIAYTDHNKLPEICIETCQESLQQAHLGIPMVDNAGYVSARNCLGVKMKNGTKEPLEVCDVKHIYASIGNECCIAIPEGTENCIFVFVITQIEIKVEAGDGVNNCIRENNINISDYLITNKFKNLKTSTRLDPNSSYLLTNNSVVVTIEPILAEEIYISRFLATPDNYCVSYGLVGYTLTRAAVLSYTVSRPMLETQGDRGADDTYTGWCNDELCFGGKGQLMDGIIGDNNDNSQSNIIVGWRCFSDGDTSIQTNCAFKLNIILAVPVNISQIIFYGYQTETKIRPPKIQLVYPDMYFTTDTSDITSNTYNVRLSINEVVDRIELNMNVQEQKKLVLSEVEVLSQDINLGPLDIGYMYSIVNATSPITPNESTTTPCEISTPTTPPIKKTTVSAMNSTLPSQKIEFCDNTAIYAVFSIIVVIQFFLLLLLFVCCIYTTYRYRGIQENIHLTRNANKERNESLYATIAVGSLESGVNNDTRVGRLPTIPVIQEESHRKPLSTTNALSIEEPLESEQKRSDTIATNPVIYDNSDAIADSSSKYEMLENTLYDTNDKQEPVSTVYGQLDVNERNVEFSAYDRVKHK